MEVERYPLILDGAQTGELSVRREGGWTLFDAQCAMAPGIIRISVYGGAREGYLGVLAPEGDHLALHCRLSRGAMREFPAPIESAGRAGQPRPAAPEPVCVPEAEPPESAQAEDEQAKTDEAEAVPAEDRDEDAPPGIEDVYWYASPDGALVCFDGENNLIALPAGDARIPDGPGGWRREIEGRDYVVFRTKNGRLLR